MVHGETLSFFFFFLFFGVYLLIIPTITADHCGLEDLLPVAGRAFDKCFLKL